MIMIYNFKSIIIGGFFSEIFSGVDGDADSVMATGSNSGRDIHFQKTDIDK